MTNPNKCQKCGTHGSVQETRDAPGAIRRRRYCENPACGHRWTTYELLEPDSASALNGMTGHMFVAVNRAQLRKIREALDVLDILIGDKPARDRKQELASDPGTAGVAA